MYRQKWYDGGMRTKQATSIRLTPEAKRLLAMLAEKLGLSQAAILELAIREKAKREGVK
jgi:predicted transcriptional regulator